MTHSDRAGNALNSFADTDANKAADAAARAFELAGMRIEKALIKAAKTGELSFKDMAESILKDLATLAVTELITSPLQSLLGSIAGGAGGSAGKPASAAAAPITITMNMSGVSDASGFSRSQGQISAAIARAVSNGQQFF